MSELNTNQILMQIHEAVGTVKAQIANLDHNLTSHMEREETVLAELDRRVDDLEKSETENRATIGTMKWLLKVFAMAGSLLIAWLTYARNK